MLIRRVFFGLLAGLLLAASVATGPASASDGRTGQVRQRAAVPIGAKPTSAKPINAIPIEWNDQALDSVRAERLGAFGAARVYAMVNVALYDAVNGIDLARGWSRREPALIDIDGAPRWGNRQAAAAAAGHAVLAELFPGRTSAFDSALADQLDGLWGSERRIEQGREWGAQVGRAVVAARADDGSSPGESLAGSTDPGRFRADWGSAQFRNMDPFGVHDPTAYLSVGPPELSSPEYAADLNEVKALGNAAEPNPEFDQIFRFWRGGGGSARPPGEWIKVTQTVAGDHWRTRWSLSATVRLFALMGMALGDAATTSAESKFTYAFWRPTTAVRNADTDGNPATVAEPDWAPRNGSIGGSPEHTSGQSTFAGAGSTILAGFYCTDDIGFSFTGDDAIAGPRTFDSFSSAAAEAGRARIMAGIHFEFSNQAGQAAGRGLASEILDTRLRSPWGDGCFAHGFNEGGPPGR